MFSVLFLGSEVVPGREQANKARTSGYLGENKPTRREQATRAENKDRFSEGKIQVVLEPLGIFCYSWHLVRSRTEFDFFARLFWFTSWNKKNTLVPYFFDKIKILSVSLTCDEWGGTRYGGTRVSAMSKNRISLRTSF